MATLPTSPSCSGILRHRILSFVVVAFGVLLLVGTAVGQASVAGTQAALEVAEAFQLYRRALQERNGDLASRLVDDLSIVWFDEARNRALSTGTEAIDTGTLSQAFLVLRARSAFTADELRTHDGRWLFSRFVERGWAGSNSMLTTLGPVAVEGETASAELSGTHGFRASFVLTKDGWKLRLIDFLIAGEQALIVLHKRSGLSRQQFALSLLRKVDATSLYDGILTGPRTKPLDANSDRREIPPRSALRTK